MEQIAVGKMANFTYLLIDNEEKEIAVIDPSWDLEKIFERINKNFQFQQKNPQKSQEKFSFPLDFYLQLLQSPPQYCIFRI